MAPDGRPALARATAWTGALLFLVSLLYCFFTYSVTMGRRSAGGNAASDVVVDVLLFSAFALHHSVFARESVRARVRRITGTALERSAYVWVASAALIAVCLLWRPLSGVAWDAGGTVGWGLRAVQTLGVWLTIRSAAVIDVLDLAGVRRAVASTAPVEFKTTGPYGWVRHPIYTGWFAIVLAEPTMTATRLLFAAISCMYLLIAIPFEERSLMESAAAYRGYAESVRWKLIPGVY